MRCDLQTHQLYAWTTDYVNGTNLRILYFISHTNRYTWKYTWGKFAKGRQYQLNVEDLADIHCPITGPYVDHTVHVKCMCECPNLLYAL